MQSTVSQAKVHHKSEQEAPETIAWGQGRASFWIHRTPYIAPHTTKLSPEWAICPLALSHRASTNGLARTESGYKDVMGKIEDK